MSRSERGQKLLKGLNFVVQKSFSWHALVLYVRKIVSLNERTGFLTKKNETHDILKKISIQKFFVSSMS